MKILFASAEVAPFAKVGGLADVAGSLPLALAARGHDVRVIMPKYLTISEGPWERQRVLDGCPVPMADHMSGCALDESRLPGSEVPIYFVEHHDYFSRPGIYGPPGGAYPDNLERLTFFSRAVLAVLEPLGWQPEGIHLNDWHTALVAVYLEGGTPATVYTIHNLGPAYQGTFPAAKLPVTGLRADYPCAKNLLVNEQLNLAAAGLSCADMVNTVSPTYAKEIAAAGFSGALAALVQARGADVWGILNGIDYTAWDPATDSKIPAHYDAKSLAGKTACKAALQQSMGLEVNPDIPLVGLVTRLDAQKGLDLLAEGLPKLTQMQLAVLGTGDPALEKVFAEAAQTRAEVGVMLKFDEALARLIYAGSDMFLMPSRYEPCGLGQMIAMRYGTLPVVRATGGLADSVIEKPRRGQKQNGFVFEAYTSAALVEALLRAAELYRRKPKVWAELVQNALGTDFSWDQSAGEYEKLYAAALKKT
ncbi:MAG: glycogen synthase [candidate division WS1 bacterium]|nr:glycogen synthase [candidate division WS1 bacterium]